MQATVCRRRSLKPNTYLERVQMCLAYWCCGLLWSRLEAMEGAARAARVYGPKEVNVPLSQKERQEK